MNELEQIFDTVNIGLVVLDRELKVRQWNRWMFLHSGIASEQIIGSSLLERFPDLNAPSFLRNCKAVLTFGNFCFFSQKLHRYLFPFKTAGSFGIKFKNMQQSCTMGPLRDEKNAITGLFVVVQDVTELASFEQKIVELNHRDELTGAYNRRHFEIRLKEECERHRRYGRGLSMAILDIDFFKKVNDTYGHPCGDEVLRSVAAHLCGLIRKTDCLARYGGEEFCFLLPETPLGAAADLAERLRAHVMGMVIPYQELEVKVTVSLGVSELIAGESPEIFLKKADDALYQAKKTGRNRVVAL